MMTSVSVIEAQVTSLKGNGFKWFPLGGVMNVGTPHSTCKHPMNISAAGFQVPSLGLSVLPNYCGKFK